MSTEIRQKVADAAAEGARRGAAEGARLRADRGTAAIRLSVDVSSYLAALRGIARALDQAERNRRTGPLSQQRRDVQRLGKAELKAAGGVVQGDDPMTDERTDLLATLTSEATVEAATRVGVQILDADADFDQLDEEGRLEVLDYHRRILMAVAALFEALPPSNVRAEERERIGRAIDDKSAEYPPDSIVQIGFRESAAIARANPAVAAEPEIV